VLFMCPVDTTYANHHAYNFSSLPPHIDTLSASSKAPKSHLMCGLCRMAHLLCGFSSMIVRFFACLSCAFGSVNDIVGEVPSRALPTR